MSDTLDDLAGVDGVVGGDRVEVRLCPGGPALVRGATAVLDGDGDAHEVTRPVVAVCRCSKTGRAPWCDGTHKAIRSRPST